MTRILWTNEDDGKSSNQGDGQDRKCGPEEKPFSSKLDVSMGRGLRLIRGHRSSRLDWRTSLHLPMEVDQVRT
jgi:hypothetical protein